MRPLMMDPNRIVRYKIGWIRRAIRESVRDPVFISLVETKFHGIPRQNQIGTLWNWQKSFLFITEPYGKDYVKHAMEFVNDGQGDCEDFVVFNSTVMKLLGIPVRIRVTDTKGKGYFTHIMIQYRSKPFGTWITFDGTFRKNGCGGEPLFFRKWRHFAI